MEPLIPALSDEDLTAALNHTGLFDDPSTTPPDELAAPWSQAGGDEKADRIDSIVTVLRNLLNQPTLHCYTVRDNHNGSMTGEVVIGYTFAYHPVVVSTVTPLQELGPTDDTVGLPQLLHLARSIITRLNTLHAQHEKGMGEAVCGPLLENMGSSNRAIDEFMAAAHVVGLAWTCPNCDCWMRCTDVTCEECGTPKP